jgi:uncharacterized protein YecT (DUF1311 family)
MNKPIALLVTCVLLALTAPASAEPAYSNTYKACLDASGGATFAMIDCINAEEKFWDQRLNRSYQALLKQLTSDRQKSLRAAQRLWLQYRDANCGFYFDPDGGQMARLTATECHLRMTADRATELTALNE